MTISFDDFCREKQCEQYIEWSFEVEMTVRDTSNMTCVSCQLVGQSYNIDVYPNNCPYKIEIKEYKRSAEKAQTWSKLNA